MKCGRYSRALFDGHEGTTFTLVDEGSRQELVLDSIEDTPSPPGQEQYALFFHGCGTAVLGQRTYHLEHAELGEMDLLLVPVGRSDRSVVYQACFNHLVPKD